MSLTDTQRALIEEAKTFFVGHDGAVGVLIPEGRRRMLIKSGEEGGPWGGTQNGGVPRGDTRSGIGVSGYAFTSGGPSQFNIATHVEGHAAAIMWQGNIRKAELIVDRVMCGVCSRRLYMALPPASTLRVYKEEDGLTIVRSSHGA